MKRVSLGIVSIILVLVLSSCVNMNGNIKPIRTEVLNFDIQTAKQMIVKGDKIISDIVVRDSVSRQEYNQFLSTMTDTYDGYIDVKWENMFFNNKEFEDNKVTTLQLQKNVFYPTIYHKDIEIVSAKITNTYYQNEFFDTSFLSIREDYLGEDINLKDWYREYIYTKNDKNDWVFYGFGGVMNFTGENFTPCYLPVK